MLPISCDGLAIFEPGKREEGPGSLKLGQSLALSQSLSHIERRLSYPESGTPCLIITRENPNGPTVFGGRIVGGMSVLQRTELFRKPRAPFLSLRAISHTTLRLVCSPLHSSVQVHYSPSSISIASFYYIPYPSFFLLYHPPPSIVSVLFPPILTKSSYPHKIFLSLNFK